jgi:glycosyltransferase involved in cell wall biosynthesis
MSPSLSVITICFNNLEELIQTCRSVDEQTVPPYEHLIVDGSTNQDIVKWRLSKYQPDYRRWIHERDKGISDAFNKGVTNAKGELTHLLNSGDKYASPKSIETVMQCFTADPSLMWTHSQFIQHRGDVDVISGLSFDPGKLWRGMRTIAHPTMFVKKELYERHGLFNTDYKIAMDYDFLVRIRNEKFKFIPIPLVYFAPGGASNTHVQKGMQEVKQSYKRHIGNSILLPLWQFRQKMLYVMLQTEWGKKLFRLKNRKKRV